MCSQQKNEGTLFWKEMESKVKENLKYKDCVLKYVKVKTVDNNEHEGWLKTIDPMSGNLILIRFNDDYTEVTGVTLIMSHGCRSLEVIKDSDSEIKSLVKDLYAAPKVSLSERKKQLIAEIEKNKLLFTEMEDESLMVLHVLIEPPYQVENCSGDVEIVLQKIQGLVASLPEVTIKEEVSVYPASFNLSDKKKLLMAWLKKNRLPVYEDDEDNLIVCECVTIDAPYGIYECSGENKGVLKHVQQLILNMPSDFPSPYAASLTVEQRKEQLIAWLKKNRLPFEENEDQSLLVCENVIIASPYDIENCSSENERILRNIKCLISNLPLTVTDEVPSTSTKTE